MVKAIICGGRGWNEREESFKFLDSCDKVINITTVISGHAKGGDAIGEDWALQRLKDVEIYKADWDKHKKAAGPIRNKQMLVEGKPDYVISFPGGTGTAHMKKIATEAGIPVVDYNDYKANLNRRRK